MGRLRPGQELEFLRAVSRHFFDDDSDEELERYRIIMEPERCFVARDHGAVVGNLAVRTGTLSLPGTASIGCAAVTAVGVAQTSRRRGLLRELLHLALDQAVEREEQVAALYASESPIYGRFGFGATAPADRYHLERTHVRFHARVADDLVRAATVDEALAEWPDLLEAGVRAVRPGCLDRPEPYWRSWLAYDPVSARAGMSGRRLVHVPGRGYATYRVRNRFTEGMPGGHVEVVELVAGDAEAEQALWQHVLDIDLTATVEVWGRPPDDALPWLLTDPLRTGRADSSPMYTRLLDVSRALSSRRYATTGQVVLHVEDPDRDQTGTYRLDAAPDGASCVRADGTEPDLSMPVDVLAALWLGGVRATRLLRARRLAEHRPGAAPALDRLLAPDLQPWTPFVF